ncbi:MAG: helix-turn-helix domain-containing protein [Candidatus Omnitrophota bacterium]
MMTIDRKKKKETYLEILELNANASFSEIKSAYLHLKKLYSAYSAVFSSISDDMSDEKRLALLERIEDAYLNLKELYSASDIDQQKKTCERSTYKNIPEFETFSGNALKLTREVVGVELQEVYLATGIPLRYLQHIENERYDLLPPPGYVRIYVGKYAEYLSLDTQKVTDDYVRAMEKKQPKDHRHKF